MSRFQIISIVDQVAAHLRSEVLSGRWQETVPGIHPLAAELGVNHKTVKKALHLLENEGFLVGKGPGRRRLIEPRMNSLTAHPLRVRILLYAKDSRKLDYHIDLRHHLEEAGHDAAFAGKSLTELGMDARRVARFVEETPADAWVVVSASREVLEWFAGQPVPAFALFGQLVGPRIAGAGPQKSLALVSAVRQLVSLGHRRIVMMEREERRKPVPGFIERAFLGELAAQGIPPGAYHLPDWGNTMEDFHRGLETSFRHTPPTALLLPYPALFVAAQQHLALRGIVAPRDVSMICLAPDVTFAWCDPPVSHIDFDSRPWVRRILRWVNNVSQGKDDRRITPTPAKFVPGGTIGPAKIQSQ